MSSPSATMNRSSGKLRNRAYVTPRQVADILANRGGGGYLGEHYVSGGRLRELIESGGRLRPQTPHLSAREWRALAASGGFLGPSSPARTAPPTCPAGSVRLPRPPPRRTGQDATRCRHRP